MKTFATLNRGIEELKATLSGMNGEAAPIAEKHANDIATAVSQLSALEQSNIRMALRELGCRASFLRDYKTVLRETRKEIAETKKDMEKEARELEFGPADERKPSEVMADDLAKWNYTFRTDELEDRVEVNGEPLTDGVMAVIHTKARDAGYGEKYSDKPSIAALDDAIRAIAEGDRYNPLQDWFNALPKWDGRYHFEELCNHVECKQKVEYRDGTERFVFDAFLWRAMLGVVAKAFYVPMCQPPMMVLAGPQNIGKSTLIEQLAPGGRRFFVSQAIHPDQKDQHRQLMRIAMWEVGELGATTRKADVESLKHFLTLQTVKVRHPYDKYDTTKPAITVFFGTVNPDGGGFLNDVTGDRRFAVVEIENIDHAYSNDVDMEQVWAQVYAHWQQDHNAWKYTPEEWAVRGSNNEKHRKEERYASDIPRLFEIWPKLKDDATEAEKKAHEDTYGDKEWWMPTGMIRDWLENNRIKCSTSADENQLGKALRLNGAVRKQRSMNGTLTWGYQGIRQRELASVPTIAGNKKEVES